MGRSQETFHKKEVRERKEKKRKEKEAKRLAKKENEKKSNLDDMIAFVDENGMITSTPPDPTKKEEIELENIQISTPKNNSIQNNDPIRKGIVTFYNESKGYGFIKDSETQEKVFVHANNIINEINENNKVSYEVEIEKKGPVATKVKLLK